MLVPDPLHRRRPTPPPHRPSGTESRDAETKQEFITTLDQLESSSGPVPFSEEDLLSEEEAKRLIEIIKQANVSQMKKLHEIGDE